METTTTLKLKVAAPPPGLGFCSSDDDHGPAEVKSKPIVEFGNWGFLQTVPNKESGDKESCVYTPPLARKSSFSRLSAKSLELCTENLGSETGSDILTDSSSIFSSPPLSPSSNSTSSYKSFDFDDWKQTTNSSSKNPLHRDASSCRKPKNFPPPLTTMSGSSSLQVRRHREDGRLIIEAVEAPFRNSYLQAERSDGRLRLCFLTGSDRAEITTSAAGEEHEEEEEEEENGDECGGESTEEEEIEEASSDVEEFNEEINLEMEMEMEKFQRLSRCKEEGHGNKGLCSNWKPALWVAIS
ncbi:UNVERIFIED_CONTAM: protein FANTASTIC FOUR 3 [Sesamum radiatum]|uniref:Protein FANTASTIC FOUR 3 n=1 Tax=Sesamum radiatum TaxID=300843 RepID=A0AAW2S865_SESRA